MKDKMLLTISLLSSGRIDTIRKCLNSIKPLLRAISSELIIVDTSGTKETRKILSEYTDQIIDFKWCNDFSKARNAGLKSAKGQWYLYLDDDEWFEDVSSIIQFFHSGEYKEYGFAFYTIRSYLNANESMFADCPLGRMIRLEKDIKFIYSIHECFNRIPGETKYLPAYAHHYGYAFKNEKESYSHTLRNIAPLLKEHKSDPHNLRHILQLAQEYNSIQEFDKSIDISIKGMKAAEAKKALQYSFLSSLYGNVVSSYLNQFQYDKVIENGELFLNNGFVDELTCYYICGKLVEAYYEIGEYEKCYKSFLKYYSGLQKVKENPTIFNQYVTNITQVCFSVKSTSGIIGYGVRVGIKLKIYDKLVEWFALFQWEEKVVFVSDEVIKDIVLDLFQEELESENQEVLQYMCNVILKRKQLENIIVSTIDNYIEKNKSIDKEIIARFASLNSDFWYFVWLKIISIDNSKEDPAIYAEFKRLFIILWRDTQNVLLYFVQNRLWNNLRDYRIDAEDLFLEILYDKWVKACRIITESCTWRQIEACNGFVIDFLNEDGLKAEIWKILYLEKKIKVKIYSDEHDYVNGSIVDRLADYVKVTIHHYKKIYREEVFEYQEDVLPEVCQVALNLKRIQKLIDKEEYVDSINYLKKLRILYPDFGEAFRGYSICLNELIEEKRDKIAKEQEEFKILAVSIKDKIRTMIGNNDIESAEKVLDQLEMLVPDDVEILDIKKEIEGMK